MRSNLLGMCSAVAAVALAGSASAAIVYSGPLDQSFTSGTVSINVTIGSTQFTMARFEVFSGTRTGIRASDAGDFNSPSYSYAVTGNPIGTSSVKVFTAGQLIETVGPQTFDEDYNLIGFSGQQYSKLLTPESEYFLEGSKLGDLNGSMGNSVFNGPVTEGYLGVIFARQYVDNFMWNPSTIRYGWVHYRAATSGNGGTILGWAYEDSGAAIVAGAIPAPGALALLGAAGLVGGRRRRN